MPVQLTNPFNPGDNDPGKTYAQAKIVRQEIDLIHKWIAVHIQYGDTVNGVWVPGAASPLKRLTIENSEPQYNNADPPEIVVPAGTEFTTMLSKLALNNETLYNGVARELYSYFITKGLLAGTVV